MQLSSLQDTSTPPLKSTMPQRQGNLYYHKGDTAQFNRALHIAEGLLTQPQDLRRAMPHEVAYPIIQALKSSPVIRVETFTPHLNTTAGLEENARLVQPSNVVNFSRPSHTADTFDLQGLSCSKRPSIKPFISKIPTVKKMREVRLGLKGSANSSHQFSEFNAALRAPLEHLVAMVAQRRGTHVIQRHTAKPPGQYPYDVEFLDLLKANVALRKKR
jgi:hypothetical protein